MLSRVPEDSMASLQRLLNGPRSPVLCPEFQAAWQRSARGGASGASKGRAAAGGSSGGARRAGKAAPSQLFGGLFSGAKPVAAAPAAPQDPAGHYAALGLSAMLSAGVTPGPDELRAAYRRAALRLHPDRQLSKPLAAQKKAAAEFARVMAAYELLRDPQLRALYDTGDYVEASLEL
jgi:hypothetical protein